MAADDSFKLPAGLELERIVSLQTAEELSSLSAYTLKRHYRDKFVELSPRRYGMRLRDVLRLGKPGEITKHRP